MAKKGIINKAKELISDKAKREIIHSIPINNGKLTAEKDIYGNINWYRNGKKLSDKELSNYKYYDSDTKAYRTLNLKEETIYDPSTDEEYTKTVASTPVYSPNYDKLGKSGNPEIHKEDAKQGIAVPEGGKEYTLRTKGRNNLVDIPESLLDSVAINTGRSKTDFFTNLALISQESSFGNKSHYLGRDDYDLNSITENERGLALSPHDLTNNHSYYTTGELDYLAAVGRNFPKAWKSGDLSLTKEESKKADKQRIAAEKDIEYAYKHGKINNGNTPHYSNNIMTDAFIRNAKNPQSYNPNEKGRATIIEQNRQELSKEKQLQEYWNTRGKKFYNKGVQEGVEPYKYDTGGPVNTQKDTIYVNGYQLVSAEDEGLTSWFNDNPKVAGMAIGAGLNGIDGERRVVLNPNLKGDNNRDAVYKNESYRHFFNSNNIQLPEITDVQKSAYVGTPYEGHDKEIIETEVARYLTGDPSHHLTDEQISNLKPFKFIYPENNLQKTSINKKSYGGYLYAKGGWMPSKETQVRIATWEGSSMYSPAPDTHKVNNSFEKEAKGFRSVIPKETWDVLSEDEKNALYSLSYNIGCGAFKQRVVPTLNKYAKGKATAADVAACMYGTKDNDPEFPGLPKRRAIEKNLFGVAAYARTGDTSYLRGDAGTPVSENGYINTPWGKVGLDSPMSEDFSSDSDMFDLASPNPSEPVTGGSSDNIQIKTGITEQDPEEVQQTNAKQSGMQAVNDLYERLNTVATMPQETNPNQRMQQEAYEGNQMYNNALQSSLALNNQFLNSSSNIGLLDLVGEMDARDSTWAAEDQVLESNEYAGGGPLDVDSSIQESTRVSPNIQFEKRDTNKWQKEATQKQYDDFKEKLEREKREKQKILEEAKIKNISNTFVGDMAYRLGADEYIQEKIDQASSTAQLVPVVGTVLGALDLGNDLQRIKNKNPNTTNLDVAEDVLSMLPTWKWAQRFRNLPKGPQVIPLTKLQKTIKGIYDTEVAGFKLADFLEDSHYTEKHKPKNNKYDHGGSLTEDEQLKEFENSKAGQIYLNYIKTGGLTEDDYNEVMEQDTFNKGKNKYFRKAAESIAARLEKEAGKNEFVFNGGKVGDKSGYYEAYQKPFIEKGNYKMANKAGRDKRDILEDYGRRWNKTHSDKFKIGKFYNGDIQFDGSYNTPSIPYSPKYIPTSNKILIDAKRSNAGVMDPLTLAHEMSHAARGNQGYDNFISRGINVFKGTSKEEDLLKAAYPELNNVYSDKYMGLGKAYNIILPSERYSINTELRNSIAQNSKLKGEELDNYIKNMSSEELRNYYNNTYIKNITDDSWKNIEENFRRALIEIP